MLLYLAGTTRTPLCSIQYLDCSSLPGPERRVPLLANEAPQQYLDILYEPQSLRNKGAPFASNTERFMACMLCDTTEASAARRFGPEISIVCYLKTVPTKAVAGT